MFKDKASPLLRQIFLLLVLSCLTSSSLADEQKYTLNFHDADIKELIKFVADTTGYTVIMDPNINAKIQVISQKPVNKQELYDLFLAILSAHGFAAVKTNNILRIVSDQRVRTEPLPVVGSGHPNAEYVTRVVDLDNISATKLIPVLRPLVPQQGHMAAYSDTNSIIITDTRENVQKLLDIIQRLDKNNKETTDVVKLKYASADEMVRVVNEALQPKTRGKTSADGNVSLVADARSNSILVTGVGQDRIKALSLITQLDSPLEKNGNARVVYLNHASAKDLAPVLSKISQNMARLGASGTKNASTSSQGSSIEADEATNSLIITAPAEVMESLISVIDKLDIPRAQVLVEAIIVEVTQGDLKNLGTDFMIASESGGFGSSNQSGALGPVAQGAFNSDKEDALTGLAAAISGVPGALWGGFNFDVNGTSFAAIISALQSTGNTNILSTPSLMTLDNNEAQIVVGQEVPFVTGSYTSTGSSGGSSSNPGNPFQTITRKNVGITLKVTPHVNEGGQITLKIEQEVSGLSATEQSTVDVVTNERKIETTVNTRDGETIVLGGLIEDDVEEVVSKVPVLGDIPIIGHLFKHTKNTVRKKNLMVFIKPTVIRNSQTVHDVSKQQYLKIRDLQRGRRAEGLGLYDDSVLPLLPKWQQQQNQQSAVTEPAPDATAPAATQQPGNQPHE